jgi:hypothetical protein
VLPHLLAQRQLLSTAALIPQRHGPMRRGGRLYALNLVLHARLAADWCCGRGLDVHALGAQCSRWPQRRCRTDLYKSNHHIRWYKRYPETAGVATNSVTTVPNTPGATGTPSNWRITGSNVPITNDWRTVPPNAHGCRGRGSERHDSHWVGSGTAPSPPAQVAPQLCSPRFEYSGRRFTKCSFAFDSSATISSGFTAARAVVRHNPSMAFLRHAF